MPNSGLTGSRIRQTRLSIGMRQADLARNVGISPSYLNLIEHNRRRIAGKLLVDISRELNVEVAVLGEGAQAGLLEAMGKAASAVPEVSSEVGRAEEMVGRFPGWAGLIEAQHHRLEALERTVEALIDRTAHDPQLAASMHEMLSVTTAIRSTAAILADGRSLEPEWQARFHRNLNEDSRRLAETAQALVAYLDATDEGKTSAEPTFPKEELEAWLAARDFHVSALEGSAAPDIGTVLDSETRLTSSATSAAYSRDYLERYRADAVAVPARELLVAMATPGFDPLSHAQKHGHDLATVLRRMAVVPGGGDAPVGLVICDSSGTLTFSKPVDGFGLPRFGAACSLWPLYQALSRPLVPIRVVVEQSGRQRLRFLTYSVAQPAPVVDFGAPPLYEATMLILPDASGDATAQPVGTSCRICARSDCRGRREPSILTQGF